MSEIRRGSSSGGGNKFPTKAPAKYFTAWSYSRYKDWVKCAFYAYCKHILKLPEPKGPALARGAAIDDLCTKYASGEIAKCPPELARFKTEFAMLRKRKKTINLQQELAFTKDWTETEWRNWDNAWVRVKMDCEYDEDDTRHIIDFKTGKIYPDNVEQLDLYAVAAILRAPEHIVRIEADLWYLDQDEGNIVGKSYTRAEALDLLKTWNKKSKPMLNDSLFKPTPSDEACKYCFFGQKAKARGGTGTCKF